jgi:hypothetical protein
MKKILSIFFMCHMALIMFSQENTSEIDANSIIGKWECFDRVDFKQCPDGPNKVFHFYPDSVINYGLDTETGCLSGEHASMDWEIKNDSLYLHIYGHDASFKLIRLNSDTLMFEFDDYIEKYHRIK